MLVKGIENSGKSLLIKRLKCIYLFNFIKINNIFPTKYRYILINISRYITHSKKFLLKYF